MYNDEPFTIPTGKYTNSQFRQFEQYMQRTVLQDGSRPGTLDQVANQLGLRPNQVQAMGMQYQREQHLAMQAVTGDRFGKASEAINHFANNFDKEYYSKDLSIDQCVAAQEKYELAQAANHFGNYQCKHRM